MVVKEGDTVKYKKGCSTSNSHYLSIDFEGVVIGFDYYQKTLIKVKITKGFAENKHKNLRPGDIALLYYYNLDITHTNNFKIWW